MVTWSDWFDEDEAPAPTPAAVDEAVKQYITYVPRKALANALARGTIRVGTLPGAPPVPLTEVHKGWLIAAMAGIPTPWKTA